eukprot:INCI12775.2.p1 GENE.INCI12775.2~~INCI12775.2.p1  ORF type:complete len:362 (-),score=54.38 INCI12775.2:1577-2662(-)
MGPRSVLDFLLSLALLFVAVAPSFSGNTGRFHTFRLGTAAARQLNATEEAPAVHSRTLSKESDLTANKVVLFVLQRKWEEPNVYDKAPHCHSGGWNHASHLLKSFGTIGRYLPDRRPVVLSPLQVFEPVHGKIPRKRRWDDWFVWHVDSDEFRATDDVWSAYKREPERFDVVDIHGDPLEILHRLEASKREVLVLLWYGTNETECWDTTPFDKLRDVINRTDLVPKLHPSLDIINAANAIQKRLGHSYATVHARRGDVLGQHVNYEGFSGPQMTNATSPQHIAEIVNIVAEDNETVLVFANEKNQTWFDELRAHVGGSRQIFFEADVIGLLPPARQSRFTDVYDFSLAFTEIQVSKLALST